ncbi:excinuclease ABC subunit B [Candidatus Falkowbacteria bacterium CG_4_10_14_0_8_um_filter_41_36]|uniref:Excinuclease ABC subunit B n=2 Tax=Candidatus Falkowiibacteriota TaxID=1752728 RepID=A0A1J4T8G4_9BACT|nr:MAG: excinuclease ABC subunit B [Candidatus Falkowbacteria bacterium CG1_02_41_21]PIZ09960.1 MAG: excinuclease ABC subunit B [Candidatus Falkowbacteria bacterium CG_4_10_14_0_8_um_filter_41_36]
MGLFKLQSDFKPAGDQAQAISKLFQGLEQGYDYQTLLGVTGSGKTFTVANLITKIEQPTLVIAPNKALAAQLYREYKNFFPENDVHYFVSYYDYYQPEAYLPITDTYIEKEAMINQEIDRLRHAATSALLSRRDVIIVASVSCIYNLGVPNSYIGSALHLEIGQTMVRADLISQLVKIQFERTSGPVGRGQFRVRGDVFEIRPKSENIIYRLELFAQKISDINVIDNVTKNILEHLNEIVIFPPKHFVSTKPQIETAIKSIQEELKERLEYFNDNKLYLEAERLERRTRYDMEMLRTIGYCHGIENYSRHLAGKLSGEAPDSLLAYFPWKDGRPDFLTIIDESHISIPQIGGMYAGDRSRKETLIKYGWRLPSALDNRPLRFPEFKQRIGRVIFTTATLGIFEKENSKQIAEQIIRPTGLIDPEIEVRPVFDKARNYSQINDIMAEIEVLAKKGERVIVNTLTKKQAEDLDSFLRGKGFKSNYLHSDIKTFERTEILKNFRLGQFDVLIGVNLLREGLDLPEVTLVAILDADREGFLRSETSLMQTMGRAARNVSGKIILYADQETNSMKKAIAEVNRRRIRQVAYNQKHHITPKTIIKKIEDLLELAEDK